MKKLTQPLTRALAHRASKLAPTTLVGAVCLALVASCAPERPGTGLTLPGTLRLGELSDDHKARLRATVSIEGLLDEEPLTIADDLSEVTGTFELAGIEEATTRDFRLRLWLDPIAEALGSPVLLARARGEVSIAPNEDTVLSPDDGEEGVFTVCGGPAGACELALDLNRNGRSNLTDLADGIEPTPPSPFLDVAPSTLQFPSGIRLGTFARQVIIVENTSSSPVVATARLVGAPGVTLSRYDSGDGGTARDRATREIDLESIGAFEERFLAVSFAPVNAFLTTGSVYIEVEDTVSGVKQATRVKIIANADGDLRPPPSAFAPETIAAGAALGGYAGAVQTFPKEQLWNGLPITELESADGVTSGLPYTSRKLTATFAEGEVDIPADGVFLVEVNPEHEMAVSLGGLNTDVDLAVLWLDENDSITTDAANNLRPARAGDSPEALEVRNDSAQARRALIVLGRQEVVDTSGDEGALSVSQLASISLSIQEGKAPVITAIDPDTGPLEGGNRVIITGRGFQPGATVTFSNSIALECVHSVAADAVTTTMDCTAPTGSLEVGKNPATIVVENPTADECTGCDGQAATLPEGYVYLPPAPQLDTLSPTKSPIQGSSGPISINGRFFSTRNGAPRVRFGDNDATSVTFIDSQRVDAIAPAHAEGIVSVTVQNRLEDDEEGNARWSLPSNGRNFTYITPAGPAPTLSAVSPDRGQIDGGLTITITGTGFTPTPAVTFDGVPSADVDFIGPTSLQAVLPPRLAPGTVNVEVINADGQSARLDGAFEYFTPAPTITNVFPGEASTTGGTFVVVNGSGFRAGVQALFTQGTETLLSPNVNRVSAGTLLVATPVVQSGGDYTLQILNVDGQSVDWDTPFAFLTPDGPAPVVEAIQPGSGFNDQSNVVRLWGTDFRPETSPFPTVLIGSEQAVVQDITTCTGVSVDAGPVPDGGMAPTNYCQGRDADSYVLTLRTPITTAEGPQVVRMINDDGQSDTSVFTYLKRLGAAPKIESVDPAQAGPGNPSQGTPADQVTVTYKNVDVQGGVMLATMTIADVFLQPGDFLSVDADSASFRMPDLGFSAPIGVEVAIENLDGQRASANLLYVPQTAGDPPEIRQVSPAQGAIGETVTISGLNFDVKSLLLGSVGVSTFSATDTTITFDVPAGATLGVATIKVVNNDDQFATSSFTVSDPALGLPPVIYSISPAEVEPAGGVLVTIAGERFDAASGTVLVGGQPVTTTPAPTITATQVTFIAPDNGSEGTVNVSMRNGDGQSAEVPFRYKNAVVIDGDPSIGLVVPNQVHALTAGERVTIAGQNLGDALSASVQPVGGGQGSYTANIIGTPGEASVIVELAQGLPATNSSMGSPFNIQLDFGAGPVPSPQFAAMAGRVLLTQIEEDGSMMLIGEWFNPDKLIGIELSDGSNTVVFSVDAATEGLILATASSPLLPGGDYLMTFFYQGLVSAVSPYDGTPPAVNPRGLHLDINSELLADTDPNGVVLYGDLDQLELWDDQLTGPFSFTLEDASGAPVADGSWQQPNSGSRQVELTIESSSPIPLGSYRAVLSVSGASRFGESDLDVRAVGRAVHMAEPANLMRGDAVRVDGIFLAGDQIVATSMGGTTLILGDVPAWFPNPFTRGAAGEAGAGAGSPDGPPRNLWLTTQPLDEDGDWTLCAQAPGVAQACTSGPLVNVTTNAKCGDAVYSAGIGGVYTIPLTHTLDPKLAACGGTRGAVLQVEGDVVGAQSVNVQFIDVPDGVRIYPGFDICDGEDQLDSCLDLTQGHPGIGGPIGGGRFGLVFEYEGALPSPEVTVQVALASDSDLNDCFTPDADEDGYLSCREDCRDDLADTNIDGTESCDGVDNDCDGVIDIITGAECTVPAASGVCAIGVQRCVQGSFACEALHTASAEEVCDNNIDDNCNGQTDTADGSCLAPGAYRLPAFGGEAPATANTIDLKGVGREAGPYDIGFYLPYYGGYVRHFWISTRGHLTFLDPEFGRSVGFDEGVSSIPNMGDALGAIAFAAPGMIHTRASKVTWEVRGAAPARRLVVDVTGFDHDDGRQPGLRPSIDVQVVIHEGTGEVFMHNRHLWGDPSRDITQGVEDWIGTRGTVLNPRRSQGRFGASSESVRHIPYQTVAICGDAICSGLTEDEDSCSEDCSEGAGFNPSEPSPGDGVCEPGEPNSYPTDCGAEVCGNGVCEPIVSENGTNCAVDCAANVCGNGTCEAGEGLFCVQDCDPLVAEDYDEDGDGLLTSVEQAGTTNPYDYDHDSDGLTDGDELLNHGTDPNDPDTDVGGEPDGAEVAGGRNPLAPGDDVAGCGDGVCHVAQGGGLDGGPAPPIDGGPEDDPAVCAFDCYCGNGRVDPGENAANCAADVNGGFSGGSGFCGNSVCEPEFGETGPEYCDADCDQVPGCGNAICDFIDNEPAYCPDDCRGEGGDAGPPPGGGCYTFEEPSPLNVAEDGTCAAPFNIDLTALGSGGAMEFGYDPMIWTPEDDAFSPPCTIANGSDVAFVLSMPPVWDRLDVSALTNPMTDVAITILDGSSCGDPDSACEDGVGSGDCEFTGVNSGDLGDPSVVTVVVTSLNGVLTEQFGVAFEVGVGGGAAAVCGDGNTEGAEDCDSGLMQGDASCDFDCTFVSCTDGIWNPAAGESCDDSNPSPGDGCDASCTVESGSVCFVDQSGFDAPTVCDSDIGNYDTDSWQNDMDNCPGLDNETQDDGDGDGVGDDCDQCPATMGTWPFGCDGGAG